MESNDSPEIPDRRETSDIPRHPSGDEGEPGLAMMLPLCKKKKKKKVSKLTVVPKSE